MKRGREEEKRETRNKKTRQKGGSNPEHVTLAEQKDSRTGKWIKIYSLFRRL
jgi:hypothetical protein